jgi:serine/threonine-protein kinase RsbT
VEGLATATSEVGRNVLVHAHDGELCGGMTHRDGRLGVVIVARDSGPGIAIIADAMCDGFSTRGSLGLGLPSARRLVHDFEIHSVVNAGTIVTLTMWAGVPASDLV